MPTCKSSFEELQTFSQPWNNLNGIIANDIKFIFNEYLISY